MRHTSEGLDSLQVLGVAVLEKNGATLGTAVELDGEGGADDNSVIGVKKVRSGRDGGGQSGDGSDGVLHFE